MPKQPPQPTILVKKADGTTVRMTLAELRVFQERQKSAPSKALATSTPVTKIFVTDNNQPDPRQKSIDDRPKSIVQSSKPWKKDDNASLLDEKLDEAHRERSGQMAANDTDAASANRVLDKLGWQVGPDARARLHSLIVSRLKDVRTDDQFLATATAPTYRGGAGLSPDQAQSLREALTDFRLRTSDFRPALSADILPTSAIRLQMADDKLRTSNINQQNSQLQRTEVPARTADAVQSGGRSQKSEVRSPNTGRPLIRDIIAPPATSPRSTGPVEEFGKFSLKDFQYSPNAAAALSRLKAKFDTAKEESYLVFMDARDAWYDSPLYRQYIASLALALERHERLPETLARSATAGFTLEVVQAMAELNHYLSV